MKHRQQQLVAGRLVEQVVDRKEHGGPNRNCARSSAEEDYTPNSS
jgi:hypothetical protein